jgi:leader peptidase (prepilin peptidase) / N-methyltransferase
MSWYHEVMIAAFFAFVIGACAGSFSSALLFRLRNGGSIVTGRSQCVKCERVLGPIDLVPIASFIAQRGRCRYCHAPVSWQYLAMELAAGLMFLGAYWHYCGFGDACHSAGSLLSAARLGIFLVFLLLVFVYDMRHGEIPDAITFTGTAVALVLNIFIAPADWPWLLIASACGAAFFAIQYVVSRGKWVGDGDITMGAMIGAMVGWPNVFAAIFGSYTFGLIVVAILVGVGRKRLTDSIPLGPLLAIGTAIVLFLPLETLNRFWYELTIR